MIVTVFYTRVIYRCPLLENIYFLYTKNFAPKPVASAVTPDTSPPLPLWGV